MPRWGALVGCPLTSLKGYGGLLESARRGLPPSFSLLPFLFLFLHKCFLSAYLQPNTVMSTGDEHEQTKNTVK